MQTQGDVSCGKARYCIETCNILVHNATRGNPIECSVCASKCMSHKSLKPLHTPVLFPPREASKQLPKMESGATLCHTLQTSWAADRWWYSAKVLVQNQAS